MGTLNLGPIVFHSQQFIFFTMSKKQVLIDKFEQKFYRIGHNYLLAPNANELSRRVLLRALSLQNCNHVFAQ